MNTADQSLNGSNSKVTMDDYYSKDIKNLELFDIPCQDLNEIFHYKNYVMEYPGPKQDYKNVQKWGTLRNFCLLILFTGFLSTKPIWCDQKSLSMNAECSYDKIDDVQYYTIVPSYLSLYNFEIVSWLLMLVLIIYELFVTDSEASRVLLLCLLYASDVFLGFLYLNDLIPIKVNNFIRIIFLIVYPKLTRDIMKNFFIFFQKIRKLIILYFSMILFTGMLLFVLYFDIQDETNDIFYSKLNFNDIYQSLYSSYTVMTLQNILNLFSFTLNNNPVFLFFLIPMYYFCVFLASAFIIGLISYFYSKVVRKQVKSLYYSNKFIKVLQYFVDAQGIVDYRKIKEFGKDFLAKDNQKDPDFQDYERIQKLKEKQENQEMKEIEQKMFNSKHFKKFSKVQQHFLYKLIYVIIDLFIATAPIMIINFKMHNMNHMWYFIISFFCILSCVDPFLNVTFALHKLKEVRKKYYLFKIMASISILILALIIPMQKRYDDKTLEQSHDLLFITFSLLCFLKFSTLVDEVLLQNNIMYNVLKLCVQFVPFLLKIFIIYFLITLFYAEIGKVLYGGKINSESIYKYQKYTDVKIREKYEYFNFNDTANSFITLFVITLKNNWIYVTEMLYFIENSFITTTFVISYATLVTLILTALIVGLSCRLIIMYFERDFQGSTDTAFDERQKQKAKLNEDEPEEIDY